MNFDNLPKYIVYWQVFGSNWTTFSYLKPFWKIEDAAKYANKKDGIIFDISKQEPLKYTVSYR